ncbi:MAG: hypothetical protein EOP83_08110 [Verrucomicrobiaceae bacterium]|nr:MAG: hypothetical protein EOP83_08110 [Verrucomicrobiaceae bacterium]
MSWPSMNDLSLVVPALGVLAMLLISVIASELADTVQSTNRMYSDFMWFSRIATFAGFALVGHVLIFLGTYMVRFD